MIRISALERGRRLEKLEFGSGRLLLYSLRYTCEGRVETPSDGFARQSRSWQAG
jgi:hypothetical protein